MDKSNLSISDIVARNSKKISKLRAKEHRERKKKYIVQLETELAQLKDKVAKLETENKQLKANSKAGSVVSTGAHIDGLLQRLEYESQYAQETLPGMAKDNPEQVRFSMIEQANDTMGSYGSCRVQLIKSCFKLIIENIVDDQMKGMIACISNLSTPKFCTIFKPNKLGKSKPKRFKISEENELLNLLSDINFSTEMSGECAEGNKIFKKEINKLREMIQELIKVRNILLNQLKFIQNYCSCEEQVSKYTK